MVDRIRFNCIYTIFWSISLYLARSYVWLTARSILLAMTDRIRCIGGGCRFDCDHCCCCGRCCCRNRRRRYGGVIDVVDVTVADAADRADAAGHTAVAPIVLVAVTSLQAHNVALALARLIVIDLVVAYWWQPDVPRQPIVVEDQAAVVVIVIIVTRIVVDMFRFVELVLWFHDDAVVGRCRRRRYSRRCCRRCSRRQGWRERRKRGHLLGLSRVRQLQPLVFVLTDALHERHQFHGQHREGLR